MWKNLKSIHWHMPAWAIALAILAPIVWGWVGLIASIGLIWLTTSLDVEWYG